jgi:hypothetical protein
MKSVSYKLYSVKRWDTSGALSFQGITYFLRGTNTGPQSAVAAGVISHCCGFTGEEQAIFEWSG